MRTLQAVFVVTLLHHVAGDGNNTNSTCDSLHHVAGDGNNTNSTGDSLNRVAGDGNNTNSTVDSLQLISRTSNAFSLKMYNALKEVDGNLFVSPVSLEILLAMAYLGSKGSVSNEIQTALNLPNSNDIIKEGFKELTDRVEKSEPLEIATRMFASVDFQIKDNFLSDARNYFYSGVGTVDYTHKPEEAVKTINSYVSEKTHNKIKDLFQTVSPDTALIMVNALYFSADWLHPFIIVRPAPFYVTRTKSVDIDMMSLSKELNYKHDDNLGAQILELPYKGTEYSMLIILPDDVEDLQSVEDKLVKSNFEDVINGLNHTDVNLKIPKFQLEKQIELNNVLKKMGMTSMFVPGAADFSGIADGNMYVSRAVQKTYINVDEKGTEAAAATGIVFTKYSLASNEKWFIANHPFIFTIVRKPENSIIFIGRFVGV